MSIVASWRPLSRDQSETPRTHTLIIAPVSDPSRGRSAPQPNRAQPTSLDGDSSSACDLRDAPTLGDTVTAIAGTPYGDQEMLGDWRNCRVLKPRDCRKYLGHSTLRYVGSTEPDIA